MLRIPSYFHFFRESVSFSRRVYFAFRRSIFGFSGVTGYGALKASYCSLLAIIVLSLSVFASSCSRKTDNNGSETAELVELDNEDTTDTVDKDTVPAKKWISFATVDDVIAFMDTSSNCYSYSQGIISKIAKENLEYAEKLLNNDHSGFIIVDKGKMKVKFYNKYGVELHSYGMACAKNFGTKHKKADSRTPEGFFSVQGVYDSTEWLFTDDDGKTSKKKGQFGPCFIRLLIPGTSQIGIHGTCAPWSIGSRSSHGCIRLTNDNIMQLKDLVEKGMPVIVIPGLRDMRVNESEGYDIPWIPSTLTSVRPGTEPKKAESKTDSISSEERKENIDSVGSLGKMRQNNLSKDEKIIVAEDSMKFE